MLFKKISIKGNTLFDFIGLKGIDIEVIQPIVIILGDNGSGKSSLLNMITPYGQNKADYEKTGKAHFEVDHLGDHYELGVDYGEKHPYYFYKDGHNLNDSGNTGYHNGIISSVFDHTQDLDKLLRFEYRMSRMQKRDRKDFLMKFNPYDLDIIYNLQKKISSALRGIKTNVKLLTQRKLILLDKAIQTEELEQLRTKVIDHQGRYRSHDLDISILTAELKNLEQQKQVLLANNRGIERLDHEHFKKQLKEFGVGLVELWRKQGDLLLDKHPDVNLKVIEDEITKIETSLVEKLDKLEQYRKYVDLDLDKEVTPRKVRLKVIEEEVGKHQKVLEVEALNKEQRATVVLAHVPNLITCCQELVRENYRILHTNQRNKVSSKYQHLVLKLQSESLSLSNMVEEDARLEMNLRAIETESYPGACVLTSCGLRRNVDLRLREWSDRRKQVQNMMGLLDKKIERYKRAGMKLKDMLDEAEGYEPWLIPFKKFASEFKSLFEHLLDGEDFIKLVNTNKLKLTSRLNGLIEKIKQQMMISDLEEERKTIIFELSKLEDPTIPVKKVIGVMIADLEKSLSQEEKELATLEQILVKQINKSEVKSIFNEMYLKLSVTQMKYRVWFDFTCLEHEIDLYKFLIDFSKKQMSACQSVLVEIESLLKEQDNIRVILDTEIIPVLTDLEIKDQEYTLLEESLGPDGLPKEYLISYLNTIIKNTNIILAQAWSYDLQLEPLTMKDEIDFSFGRSVNGHYADDISKCSESQKDIIDIAWCLAMIITLNYGRDFPVYLDECDRHFDEGHRERLVSLISNMIKLGSLRQIFLVNHHAALSGALTASQTICLSANNISVPSVYNESTILHYKS